MTAEYRSGFTWRSALIILISSLIWMPVALYIQLVSGIVTISMVSIVMAFVAVEITRLLGSPISRQELLFVYLMSSLAASATGYIWQIWKGYFITSPLSWSFKIDGVPIPELYPQWYAPPPDSPAYVLRTFFHTDWLIPLLVTNVQAGLFFYLTELSLTMILSYIFVEIEKLPFPLAEIDASVVTTLSERKPERIRMFTLALYPGLIWGVILYILPLLTGYMIIPLPWYDLTPFTAQFMPGALIGVMTDLIPYIGGFFISFTVTVYMFIASVAVWVVGNYLTLTFFKDLFPEWASEYFAGMGFGGVLARSTLRIWIAPQIASAFVMMIIALIYYAKPVARGLKSLAKVSLVKVAGYPSLKWLITCYILGTLGSVTLFYLLVPELPVWIPLLLSVGISFLNGIISVVSLGVTGFSVSIPYEWNLALYLSGYRGVAAWVFTPIIGGLPSSEGGSPGWVYMIKVGSLTGTRPADVLKALIFTIIIYNILSFVWMEFFWRIAPIPSAAYPYALSTWPTGIINSAVWMTGQIGVKPWLFYYSFFGVLAISLAGEAASKFLGLPFSSVGLITGMGMTPPSSLALFIGSALNKFLLPRFFGEKRWGENKSAMAAGLVSGEGLAAAIAVAISLIMKATWIKPW
jgi:hypothetical protein